MQKMAKNPQEVVFEGWLTKSPPTKRIWRARWRRRWFLLTHSGELPGQYILTYYTDRNCRKLKGVINLDHCEQVDLGLKLDERKLKFDHVFDIKTPTRTYYLAADTENEMRSWVTCICKVCGLKSTSEEDAQIPMPCPDVEITEEPNESRRVTLMNNFNETPPISPVSTSPYIPISECITGKSPIFDPKDFKTLLQYNMKNAFIKSETIHHTNDSYELPSRNYLNCLNVQEDPRFYDCPRKLAPHAPKNDIDNEKNHSPLQSPTDSDSVFNDEDWTHNTSSDLNTSKHTGRSEGSSDEGENLIVTKKFTKTNSGAPPPRPPKPAHKASLPCYLNLTSTKTERKGEPEPDCSKPAEPQQPPKVLTDDMYDFPRSHHIESEATLKRRHCYNNAAPVPCPDGTIFRYDISPKPGTSTTVFRYDLEESQEEPPSPAHSHSSSAPAYSNLPSPSLSATQLMPPPMVNRELKPRRKLSDSHSISSNPEPPSPRNAPSVDRKLKPPTTPLQEAHQRKHFNTEEDHRKIRAAPSPVPPNLGRSHDSLLTQTEEQVYHHLAGKMQYLDLDLDGSTASFSSHSTKTPPVKHQEDTVYKKVDFMKTQAFNITRNILEKERQEPLTFVKK